VKIGLIYQKFVSSGGLEGYLFQFAKALLDAGHELHVLTGQTDENTDALPVEFSRVPLPRSKTRALLAFERAVIEHGDELPVDVTFGFGRTTRQNIHRAGAGCHAAYLPLLHPLKRLGFKSRIELALEKDLYTSGRTDHFVVNSSLVREQLIEHYAVPEEKFTVVHTAVDTDRFRPALDDATRVALRKNLGVEDDRPVLLFVSRAHRRKGLPALLEHWPAIHDETGAQLWIAGPDIARFIKALPSNYHASITHQDEVEDIVPLYQAADLFVHPTLYDACANTVLQSMACGLPGLISSSDGACEFVTEGETGWLLGEPASLPKKIATALAADREAIGGAARHRVEPLTWQAHVTAWEEIAKAHAH
jgi:glycosyltransferase involved in cell wall biosynthesis